MIEWVVYQCLSSQFRRRYPQSTCAIADVGQMLSKRYCGHLVAACEAKPAVIPKAGPITINSSCDDFFLTPQHLDCYAILSAMAETRRNELILSSESIIYSASMIHLSLPLCHLSVEFHY